MVHSITLATGDSEIATNDVLGRLNYAAPGEAQTGDARLIGASITAVAEGAFTTSANATKLVFSTGASETAAEKMSLSSAGLLTITDDLVIKDGGTIGGSADADLLTLDDGALTVAGTLAATTGTFSGILKTDDATDATSTTDGSLQTDGGLSVAKDIVAGNDLILLSDAAVVHFGASKEITLTHVADSGLTLKHTAGGDNKPLLLTLATGETTLIADEVLSKIAFQAPSEASGGDSVEVAAAIQAVAEGAFNTTSNATRLEFMTGASEAATVKMTLSSAGVLNVSGAITQGIATSAEDPEDDATLDIDLSDGNYFEVDLGANVTDIDFTKGAVGQRFIIRFEQPAGDNHSIAYNAVTHDLDGGGSPASVTVSWPGASAPTMTATNDKADTYGFIVRAEGHFDGYIIGQNIAETTN